MDTTKDTTRRTAGLVGALFIIGTAAGVLSVILTNGLLTGPDFLSKVSANQYQVVSAALCVLIMGLALAVIPVLVFPILKKQNEALALGYVVFRGGLETVTYLVIVVSWLLLIPLSHEYVSAGAPNAPYFLTLGNLLIRSGEIGSALTAVVFPLGALMFYVLLYQTKLLPRWLSVWGMIGVVLDLLVTGLGGLYGLSAAMSTLEGVFNMPIFIQEMVMAVWLIVRGFNQSSVVVRTFSISQAKQGR